MRLWLLPLMPLLTAMVCGPIQSDPNPNPCQAPAEIGDATVEIGARTSLGFLALEDGDAIPLVEGIQGSDMVGIRLRLASGSLPQCFEQTTTIRDASGEGLAHVELPLQTRVDQDDNEKRSTDTLWLPFEGASPRIGDELVVEVTTGAKTISRKLQLVEDRPRVRARFDSLTLAPSGSGIVVLELDEPAPAGGITVLLREEVPNTALALSPKAHIPEGATEHSLRIHAAQDGNLDTIFLIDASGQSSFYLSIEDAHTPNLSEPLTINEIYPGSAAQDADFNCDGLSDQADTFVEIHNPRTSAVDLQSVALMNRVGTASELLHQFGSETLGPGETLVLMNSPGAPGCLSKQPLAAPTLLPAAGTSIFIRNSYGSVGELLLPAELPASSLVRSPEFVGEFLLHTEVSASGLAASPGMRSDGRPFAEESGEE